MIFEIPKEELSFTLDDAVDPDEVKDGELWLWYWLLRVYVFAIKMLAVKMSKKNK
jgi:hypothetical protein